MSNSSYLVKRRSLSLSLPCNLLSSSWGCWSFTCFFLFLLFVALAFDLCLRCLFTKFALKSFEIIIKNLYFLFAITEKNWIPSPPILEEKGRSFLSMSGQLMPPDIEGITLVLTTSSSCFNRLLIFEIVCVSCFVFCFSPLLKHQ